jgi:hypothetical protein
VDHGNGYITVVDRKKDMVRSWLDVHQLWNPGQVQVS